MATAATETRPFMLVLEYAPRLVADFGSIRVYDGPFIYSVQWPMKRKRR